MGYMQYGCAYTFNKSVTNGCSLFSLSEVSGDDDEGMTGRQLHWTNTLGREKRRGGNKRGREGGRGKGE